MRVRSTSWQSCWPPSKNSDARGTCEKHRSSMVGSATAPAVPRNTCTATGDNMVCVCAQVLHDFRARDAVTCTHMPSAIAGKYSA